MKIGFDVSQTGTTKAGCGFFADNLIQAISAIDSQHHYMLYPVFGDHYWDPNLENTSTIALPNFSRKILHKSLPEAVKFWKNLPLDWEDSLGNVDILHSNNFFCPPKPKHARLIYTLYDLSFLEYPDCTTEHNRIICFNGVFKASLHADFIIAISHSTRQHFLNTFPHYPEDRIAVVHPASRFDGSTPALPKSPKLQALPEQFWLTVGTLEPRKNLKRLLNVYKKLKEKHPDTHPLVLAGKLGWLDENIEDLIEQLGLTPFVHILGYVSNDELQWLYQHCFCMIYPSLFEGFGLPVLEAMNYGAPIISSNASSLPEVVGQAGLLINPLNEAEILEAMQDIAFKPTLRKQLKELALIQAKLFFWEKTAKETINIYQKVCLTPKITFNKSMTPMAQL